LTLVAGIVVPIVLEALKLCGVHVWAFLKTRKGPSKKFGLRKSALGQEQTGVGQAPMSALSLKADIDRKRREVCFVPQADVTTARPDRAKPPSEPSYHALES